MLWVSYVFPTIEVYYNVYIGNICQQLNNLQLKCSIRFRKKELSRENDIELYLDEINAKDMLGCKHQDFEHFKSTSGSIIRKWFIKTANWVLS